MRKITPRSGSLFPDGSTSLSAAAPLLSRPRLGLLACLAALAPLAHAGCASVPSPLAPQVRGSVGLPALGVLTDAVELPTRGPGFRKLRPWSKTYFGTPSLVGALTDAAARLDRVDRGSPPLLVGDIAGPRGGPLSGHHSHRTGRDVDLLFFYTTPAGVPIDAPGFVRVGADGLARVPEEQGGPLWVRLDVPRSWALVRALLEQRRAEVEWIFVVSHVEALLIEYARARGEPLDLVWRAESVLQQPGDSAPHDDHFHLRIACSHEEMVAGCFSGGPQWPWMPPPPAWTPELDAQLTAMDDE
jgi:penicillin-insensitive murein DD-endopeptidase